QAERPLGSQNVSGPVEKSGYVERRNVDWPPGKEYARLRQGEQQHDAGAAVGQGVEQGVRDCAARPHRRKPAVRTARYDGCQRGRKHDQEKRGVEKSAMAEEAVIRE